MKTLYRQFIVATLFILLVAVVIGFTLANAFYLTVMKEQATEQNLDIAEEIVSSLNMAPHSQDSFNSYLESVSNLGYQIAIVDSTGQKTFYGDAFDNNALPEEAERVLTDGKIYKGLDNLSSRIFMIAHFTNQLHNTVGVPFTFEGGAYGLFIRPDTKLVGADIHSVLIAFVLAIAIVSIAGMIWLARQLTARLFN
ncbi:hypothetical protein [Planococcus sp. 107-1]|uniref:hypothetical protein n=1 Tax=Planococcus sp. 107-1 TaxID=2908840 RepID=UPI001F32D3A3|nr:hypothetical protein [Planococcus sp. 107-1]UJF27533.1 hypothetical protein L0M13_03385 [Planococcus sp. 107-1]